MNLKSRAVVGIAFLAAVMMLIIFSTARTLRYWQGWAYLGVFFAGCIPTTVYLFRHDQALLEWRLSAGPLAEKRPVQRIIMLFTSLGFIALLVVPALDWHLGWSSVPVAAELGGLALIGAGLYAISLVYKVNTYTAATVRVEQGQSVVSTGPYALVRHPMYAAALLMFVGTPPALGSWWGLLAIAAIMPFLIWRLLDEEKLLARDLPGYSDYQRKVRWRLVPGLF